MAKNIGLGVAYPSRQENGETLLAARKKTDLASYQDVDLQLIAVISWPRTGGYQDPKSNRENTVSNSPVSNSL